MSDLSVFARKLYLSEEAARPSARDARTVLDVKSPRGGQPCLVPAHADAGAGGDGPVGQRCPLFQEQEGVRRAQVGSIEAPVDVQRLAQAGRAASLTTFKQLCIP